MVVLTIVQHGVDSRGGDTGFRLMRFHDHELPGIELAAEQADQRCGNDDQRERHVQEENRQESGCR